MADERQDPEEAEPTTRTLERRPPLGRAARGGAFLAAALSLGSVVWAYLEYAGRARAPLLALAFAGACIGAAFTVLLGFRTSFSFETRTGARDTLIPGAPPPPAPPVAPMDPHARRRFLALVGAVGTTLLAAVLLPLRSLGTWPRKVLFATSWRPGVRLLSLAGLPVRPADLPPRSATAVVPASAPGDPNSTAVLVRLADATAAAAAAAGPLDALRAYSRICTHAGCAVSMYRAAAEELVCPCHHSAFAAWDGHVVGGPAGGPLPRLPLALDADGYLVAAGRFDRAIGPPMG